MVEAGRLGANEGDRLPISVENDPASDVGLDADGYDDGTGVSQPDCTIPP